MTPLDAAFAKVMDRVRKEGTHIILASSQKEVWGVKSGFRDFKSRHPEGEGISVYVKKPPIAGGRWMIEFKENVTQKLVESSIEGGTSAPPKEEDVERMLDAAFRAAREG